MNHSAAKRPSATAQSLEKWLSMVETLDFSALPEIVHPDATFRSPMSLQAWPAPALVLILRTVFSILKEFAYHRQFATHDEHSVVLEFSARFGDNYLKGADLIRFDEVGLITDFEVMIRPLSGLQAFGSEVGKRLQIQSSGNKA